MKMNAIAMYQNVTAEDAAKAQSDLDTTKPIIDPYRPEVSEKLGGITQKQQIGGAFYHLLFVSFFVFGGITLLGTLTGEIEIVRG